MSRLTAQKLLELNILSKEDSGDDSEDQSEIDSVEFDFRNEDGEIELEECVDEEMTQKDIVNCPSKRLRTEPSHSGFLTSPNRIIFGGTTKKTRFRLNGSQIQMKHFNGLHLNTHVLYLY